MATFLLFSDVHVHPHKKSQERLQDCIAALEWVFETAKSKKVDAVLFGGDLLHDRQKIDSLTYNLVFNVFEKYQNESFQTYLLLGNHDLWYASSWSVSSVRPFKAIKNVTVIDKTCELDINGVNWHFIPYTHEPISELETLKSKVESSYLLGHLAIDGARLNSAGSIADVIIEHDGDMTVVGCDLFKRYKRAFFGHYHSAQKLTETIEYIGSPLQLSFGEAHEDKYILLLNSDDDSLSYIENTFSPKHFYIQESEIENYNSEEIKNGFVCIISESNDASSNKKNMAKVVEELKASTVQIKKQIKKQDEHALADAKDLIANQDKLLERYVEQVQNLTLDKKTLIEIGNKIVKAAEDAKD